MAIEAMKGSGVSLEGGSSTAEAVTAETSAKKDVTFGAEAPDMPARKTINIMTGDTAGSNIDTEDKKNQSVSNDSQIKKAVDEINKKAHNSEAIFGIHDKTNRVMIKIVDKDTKKVLKEYPPEQTLDMIAKVWETAGLLVDHKL